MEHFAADDGCRIAFEFHRRKNAPVVVLSPSLGTDMTLFDDQMDALGKFSVLRYDPRGHGASAAPAGDYSLDRLGRDVLELLDHLGLERVDFAGVSLGGMTGEWLGYRAPERIGRLVLANTSAYMGPPSGWAERMARVREQGMAAMVEPVLSRWFTRAFLSGSNLGVERVRAVLSATAPEGYAGCCAAIRDMDLRPTLPLIQAPTLVIAGAFDPATPCDHSGFLTEHIPDSRIFVLEAAHLSNIEQAAQFSEKLTQFLGTGT